MSTSTSPLSASSEWMNTFPRQKLPFRQKTEEWMKNCIDSGINLATLNNSYRRSPQATKLANYRLYNGIIDPADFEYVTNPFKFQTPVAFPANFQYYDIVSPIFNLLLGEEAKRQFNAVVRAVNPEAIHRKEQKKKDMMLDLVNLLFQQELEKEQRAQAAASGQPLPPKEGEQVPGSPEEAMAAPPKTVEEVEKYMTYTYKDISEQTMQHTLNYYRKLLKLDVHFQEGMKDALLAAEEIYHIREVNGEVFFERCNPLEMYFVLQHNSDYIDDSELIVEDTVMSYSKIIDQYYEDLSDKQIDSLEQRYSRTSNAGDLPIQNPSYLGVSSAIQAQRSPHDIPVRKVTWCSKRKMLRVFGMDPITGEPTENIYDESYRVNKEAGEIAEHFWINEYFYGVKIDEDIYLQMGPKRDQFRSLENLSRCKSGYVGTVYNATNATATSLMDRLKPWAYLYTVIWYRTELLIAANQGKIALIDAAMLPDEWDFDKWLYYASAMKFGFVDSFKEGRKGAATGKLAGNMQSQTKTLDLETGNAIQGHIELLGFIEQKIERVSGVSAQRMGEISSSELVGTSERAVTQSSHITEKWFAVHNQTKLRVLETILEVAKATLKEEPKRLQYMTDDMGAVFFTVDPEVVTNDVHGLFVTDSQKDLFAIEALKGLTQAALQNDKATLSQVVDLYTSESLAAIKNGLKNAEVQAQINAQQAQQQQAEAAQRIEQMRADALQAQRDFDAEQNELDRMNKIEVAEIQVFARQQDLDQDNDGIPDPVELAKLDLERHALQMQDKHKQADILMQRRDQELKSKEIESKEKQTKENNEAKVRVARLKPKPKPASKK